MPSFPVNPTRFDPYKNFKFGVYWDGRQVAGISKVSALHRTTQVILHREGGDPSLARRSPGTTAYDPITLERGLTHDPEFEAWANKVFSLGAKAGLEASLKDFRKDLRIVLHNEAGQVVFAYEVFRCWPSEYIALPELDGAGRAVAIETLVLQHEGWRRDPEVTEPVEPSLPQSD